jgi:hypothetical protein
LGTGVFAVAGEVLEQGIGHKDYLLTIDITDNILSASIEGWLLYLGS